MLLTIGNERIMREYYELLCVNKLDNSGEVDKFLETQKLPQLAREELEVSLEPERFLRRRRHRWCRLVFEDDWPRRQRAMWFPREACGPRRLGVPSFCFDSIFRMRKLKHGHVIEDQRRWAVEDIREERYTVPGQEAGSEVELRRRKPTPCLSSATRTWAWEDKWPLLGGGGRISQETQASGEARRCRGHRLGLYFQRNRCLGGRKESD